MLGEVVHIGFSSHVILQSLNTRIKELGEGQWKHTTGIWHALPTSFLFHLEDGSPERSFFSALETLVCTAALLNFFFHPRQPLFLYALP